MYDLFYGLLVVNSRVSLIRFWWLQNKVKVTNGKNHVKFFRFTCKNSKKAQAIMKENQYNEDLGFLKTWNDLGFNERQYLLVHLSLNCFHALKILFSTLLKLKMIFFLNQRNKWILF